MHQAYMVNIPDMINDLKIFPEQTDFVIKSYTSVYKNSYNNVSMDVQMQSMCKKIFERFNIKLKSVNLNELATYRYLIHFHIFIL